MVREQHLRQLRSRIHEVCRELDVATARCAQSRASGSGAADALDCRRLDRLNQELVGLLERQRVLEDARRCG